MNELLRSNGVSTVVCPFFEPENRQMPEGLNYSVLEEELDGADMAVTFGGDGTILHAARILSEQSIPILAVNMGTMGFMAELEPEEMEEQVHRVLSGDYRIEKRMMLDVSMARDGQTVYSDFALNDVVIGSMARAIDLKIFGDEHAIAQYSGDGVVIATPTGSTAYSMSAGGPVVEPSAENIIVTPICAHVLVAKSFVLAPDRCISAVYGMHRANPAYLAVDGQSIPLCGGDVVTVRKSERETRMIRLSNKSFYRKVHEKLGERT